MKTLRQKKALLSTLRLFYRRGHSAHRLDCKHYGWGERKFKQAFEIPTGTPVTGGLAGPYLFCFFLLTVRTFA